MPNEQVAQGPGLVYTLKGIDSYRLVDLREHVRLLESQVWITSDALPLAVQTVLSYNYYSPIKSTIDARDPENMLKDFTETIVKKAIATHTALEFVTQKKKLQIYIRVSIRLKMICFLLRLKSKYQYFCALYLKDELARSIQRIGVRVTRVEFYSVRLANKEELIKNRITGYYYK